MPAPASLQAGLSADQLAFANAKYEELVKHGLPEAQAEKSVKALLEYKTLPPNYAKNKRVTHVYACLKIKPGVLKGSNKGQDMKELKAGLKAYSEAAQKSEGQVSAAYSIDEDSKGTGEIQFFELYEAPIAMDTHIGNCFPSYTRVVQFADMAEIVCTCDPADRLFWKTSAAAWGAKKFVVAGAV